LFGEDALAVDIGFDGAPADGQGKMDPGGFRSGVPLLNVEVNIIAQLLAVIVTHQYAQDSVTLRASVDGGFSITVATFATQQHVYTRIAQEITPAATT